MKDCLIEMLKQNYQCILFVMLQYCSSANCFYKFNAQLLIVQQQCNACLLQTHNERLMTTFVTFFPLARSKFRIMNARIDRRRSSAAVYRRRRETRVPIE